MWPASLAVNAAGCPSREQPRPCIMCVCVCVCVCVCACVACVCVCVCVCMCVICVCVCVLMCTAEREHHQSGVLKPFAPFAPFACELETTFHFNKRARYGSP